jgi:hypothetical protein
MSVLHKTGLKRQKSHSRLMCCKYDGLHWTETIFVGFNLNITKNSTYQKFLGKINPSKRFKQKIRARKEKLFLRHSVLGY